MNVGIMIYLIRFEHGGWTAAFATSGWRNDGVAL